MNDQDRFDLLMLANLVLIIVAIHLLRMRLNCLEARHTALVGRVAQLEGHTHESGPMESPGIAAGAAGAGSD